MTSTVLPFRLPADHHEGDPFVLTQRHRVEAANWAAQLGPGWTADAILADDGGIGLVIATPRDEEEDTLSWQIERTARGFEVFDAWSGKTLAVCRTLAAALFAVENAERVPANDNQAA